MTEIEVSYIPPVVNLPIESEYKVTSQQEESTSTKYTIITSKSDTKSLSYSVIEDESISKSLTYVVVLRINKSMEYYVHVPVDYEGGANLEAGGSVYETGQAEFGGDSELEGDGEREYAGYPTIEGSAEFEGDGEEEYVRIEKRYMVKVYTQDGQFRGIWDDVIGDINIREEINSAGSAVTLLLPRLADDFGEGSSVAYGNHVEIWISDKDQPQGMKLFTGEITRYNADFINEVVEVTVTGYGGRMGEMVMESQNNIDHEQTQSSENLYFNHSSDDKGIILEYQSGDFTNLSAFDIKIGFNGNYSKGDASRDVTFAIYSTLSDAQTYGSGGSGSQANYGPALRVAHRTVSNFVIENTRINLPTPASISQNTKYYIAVSVWDDNVPSLAGPPGFPPQTGTHFIEVSSSSVYADGTTYQYDTGTETWTDEEKDAYLVTYSTELLTKLEYFSQDPADILKSIVDNYQANGGRITYTPESIDNTNTTVSYTFNANTVLEGVDKVLELAPEGWHYYIDQANNVMHFHPMSEEPDHVAAIGRDVAHLNIDKNTDNIVNVLYFKGGGENPIFKKYSIQTSVDNYGIKARRYTDRRVTLDETANTIADKVMNGTPEVFVDVAIIDGNINDLGYDIESIMPGQMIRISNAGEGATSQFDVSRFDEDVFDYDPEDISTIGFQVTSKHYTPDMAILGLSTTPPDITKRIQDIKRNLKELDYEDNPDSPET